MYNCLGQGSYGETVLAIVITGSIALVLGALTVSVVVLKYSRRKPKVLTEEDIQKFMVGGTASNPNDDTASELTVSAKVLSEVDDIYDSILGLPYNTDFEFPRNSFSYGNLF